MQSNFYPLGGVVAGYYLLSCIENDKLDLPALNWKGFH